MPALTVGRGVAVLAAAGVLLGGGASSAVAAEPRTQAAALRSLVGQTRALPASTTTRAQRRGLLRLATRARRVAKARPCGAVADLTRYRLVLRSVKVRPGGSRARRAATKRLAALGPASVVASRRLLATRRTKACGGGTTPSTAKATRTTVMRSDADGMTIRVQLPALRFVAETGGGRSWTRLALPDTDVPGAAGTPGIPVASSTFAVPDGARVAVRPGATSSYTLDGVDVYPVQPPAVDQAPPSGLTPRPDFFAGVFAARPFALSRKAYADDGLVPAKPADGRILGTSRDVVIGNLTVPAAQYDPVKRRLKVLNSVDVRVAFEGGAKRFNPELGSPWEQPQRRLVAGLLNAGVARADFGLALQRCGEEMLVITNPATRPAADTFAVARRAAGLRTTVVETGAAAGQIGTTTAAIQTFIRGRLTAVGCIHPSYVTILGDDDLVPTFPGIGGIVSDLQYSMRNDADELPDVAVGRIIGNDQAKVQTAVDKIIGYETTAPTGAFLSRATIASQFQDTDEEGEVNDGQEDRTFIQFAERVRSGLVGRGVAVDRIYDDAPSTNPLRFNDGTDIPASLRKPAFAWDGDGADVTSAWNEGRFMVVHRDHGWSDGWGDPYFTTNEVNALTNGALLPVVLSINCSSARYDDDETSFVGEALVKANGGAVGVFGDTRDSPSWHNTQIALGFVDAMLPSVLSGEGPALKQRMGDALIHGKLRLAALAPPSGPGIAGGDGNTRKELYLWHYFGDPSMQMWGGGSPPIVYNPAVFTAVYKERVVPIPDPGPKYEVNVLLPRELLGQPISLLRNGQVVGKAIAQDGSVTIPAAFGDGSVKPGELQVALEADGAQPVSVPVQGVPEPPPPTGPGGPTGPTGPPPPADLIVSALGSSSVSVKNQGAGPSAAFTTTITDSQSNVLTLSFGALAAGATATQPYDCVKLLRSRTAKADAGSAVTESDEANNTASGVFACN